MVPPPRKASCVTSLGRMPGTASRGKVSAPTAPLPKETKKIGTAMFELRSAANFALVATTCTTCFSVSATWSDEAGHNRTPPRRFSTARSVSVPQLLFSLAELPHVADDVWDAVCKKCSWPVLARLW